MGRAGIPADSLPVQQLIKLENSLLARVGLKAPRSILQLIKLVGLSPGTISLWEDIESGWLAEGREFPGYPPVYHYIDDDMAMAILNKALTPEQKAFLWTPDDYLGE